MSLPGAKWATTPPGKIPARRCDRVRAKLRVPPALSREATPSLATLDLLLGSSLKRRCVMQITRIQNATYVLEKIRDLGFEPGKRLRKMHDTVCRGLVAYDDPDFPIALQADREISRPVWPEISPCLTGGGVYA